MNHKNDLGSWHTVITHEIAHEFDLKELAMSLTMEKYLQELPTSFTHEFEPQELPTILTDENYTSDTCGLAHFQILLKTLLFWKLEQR